MEYAVKCPRCKKEINLWDITFHLEQCKEKMEEYKQDEILEITWVDIEHKSEWLKEQEAKDYPLPECYVVGYFLNQDEQVIRISPFLGKDKERDVAVLPKGVIKNIKRLQ